jgi:hypothetical protein
MYFAYNQWNPLPTKKDRVVMQQLALASSRAIQQMFGVMVLLFVGENGTLEQ